MEVNYEEEVNRWREDWNLFAEVVLGVNLDKQQQEILRSIQVNRFTSVASGTARGKDFVAAVAAICFLYLTPRWKDGALIENTKVAMTAPTDRQIGNIMIPEISRLFKRAQILPGRLVGYDIRTNDKEWFLTGFKADEGNHEAWSGFHAVNTMFLVTEASGLSELVYNAIEGNLQGNSRLVLIFNPNRPTGYAAASQKSPRFNKFRLDSLDAINVKEKRQIIPGQVDYEWVRDKVENWCEPIQESDFNPGEGDFYFDLHGFEQPFRPNDLFRVKVRGMFPKVSDDVLIPLPWIELAQERWRKQQQFGRPQGIPLRLGVDIAGMGRDNTNFCHRFGDYVEKFEAVHAGGVANHMAMAGKTKMILQANTNIFSGLYPQAFLDTIGEGAGVFSRLEEMEVPGVFSVKAGAAAEFEGTRLVDETGEYQFKNLRAYLFWAVRDWLNPLYKHNSMLPPNDKLVEELTQMMWSLNSKGIIELEPKIKLKERIGRSPDDSDSLALSFYPQPDKLPSARTESIGGYFH